MHMFVTAIFDQQMLTGVCRTGAKRTYLPYPQSESESDNATEGVSWKARDLWSAPVEWSNHEMQERKSNESMQSSAATIGGHPLSGGCCAIAVMQYAVVRGCGRRIAAA